MVACDQLFLSAIRLYVRSVYVCVMFVCRLHALYSQCVHRIQNHSMGFARSHVSATQTCLPLHCTAENTASILTAVDRVL